MLADAIYRLEIFLYVNQDREAMTSRVDACEKLRKRREVVVAGGTEAVPDPWLGNDVGWFVGELDLFAQVADCDAQIFGLICVGTPHRVQEGAVCEHLSGVLGHIHQKIELLRRQMRVLSANDDAVLRYVDQEVAGFDDLWRFIISCSAAA